MPSGCKKYVLVQFAPGMLFIVIMCMVLGFLQTSCSSEKSGKSLLPDVCHQQKLREIVAVRCLSKAKSRINRCCQMTVKKKSRKNAAVRCLSIAKSRLNRSCQNLSKKLKVCGLAVDIFCCDCVSSWSYSLTFLIFYSISIS